MGKQNNRTCVICGRHYSFCPVCNNGDSGKPTWYFVFDSENCHDIYETCVSYRDKKISIKEAKERIEKLNTDGLDDFADATKEQIKEILNYSEPIKNVKEEKQNTETVSEKKNSTEKTNYNKISKFKK